MKKVIIFLLTFILGLSAIFAQKRPGPLKSKFLEHMRTGITGHSNASIYQARPVNTTVQRLDSIEYLYWDSQTSIFELWDKDVFDWYDELITHIYELELLNSSWNMYGYWEFNYFSGSPLKQDITYFDQTAQGYVPYSKEIYEYDMNTGQKTLKVELNQNNGTLEYFKKAEYIYANATAPLPDTIKTYNWDPAISDWVKDELIIIQYYDPENFLVMIEKEWDAASNSFVNDLRITRTYDSNDRIEQELKERWNNNQWEYEYKREYDFQFSGSLVLCTETGFSRAGGSWNPEYQEVSIFEENGFLYSLERYRNWDPATGNWEGDYAYTYNYLGTSSVEEFYSWDTATNSWSIVPDEVYTTYYDTAYQYDDLLKPPTSDFFCRLL